MESVLTGTRDNVTRKSSANYPMLKLKNVVTLTTVPGPTANFGTMLKENILFQRKPGLQGETNKDKQKNKTITKRI